MNTRIVNRTLQGAIAVLFVAFAGQVGYEYWFNKPDPVVLAAWAYDPRSLGEAKGLSKEIVEAEVTKVERADDLVIKAPGEPGGVERIAIEMVSMRVKGAMKGKPGQEIRLFRTAGIPVERHKMPNMKNAPRKPKGATPMPKRATPFVANTINVHDDQAYKVGERYVMFLREGPKVRVKGKRFATKTLLNPSARFRVGKDNKMQPLIREGFGRAFRGKGLSQFKASVQKMKEVRPVPGKKPGQLILPKLKLQPRKMIPKLPGGIRPRGIEGSEAPLDMEQEFGELEVPTEGEAPELQ